MDFIDQSVSDHNAFVRIAVHEDKHVIIRRWSSYK